MARKKMRWVACIRALIVLATLTVLPIRAQTVVLNQPDGSGDQVDEGLDFATTDLGMAWDMSGPPVPSFNTVMFGFDPGSFSITDGIWEALTSTADPQIRIHHPPVADPAPIDADQYRLLSFRMYSSQNDIARIYWFFDFTTTQFAFSDAIPVMSGWHTYVVDLAQIGIAGTGGGATGWNGSVQRLRIDPGNAGGVTIRLDWIRLTRADTLSVLPVDWTGLAPVGSTLELFVDRDDSGFDGVKIGEVASAAASGSFPWGENLSYFQTGRPYPLPTSLQPDAYFIYAAVGGTPVAYSPGPLTVTPQSKSITLTQPDGIADQVGEGEDFASTVLGMPWDMSGEPYPDLPAVMEDFDPGSFMIQDGTWDAFTTSNDPRINIHSAGLLGVAQPILKLGSRFPIDTDKFHFLTFRMFSDQAGHAQIFWFYDGTFTSFAWTQGIPVQTGWHVYAIDLDSYPLAGTVGGATGWNGTVHGLAIDPVATGNNVNIKIDWIRLTTSETPSPFLGGQGTLSYPIQWTDLSPAGATIDFFIDTDNSGFDGVRIGSVAGAPVSGSFEWGANLLYEGTGVPFPLPSGFQPGDYYVYTSVNGTPQDYSGGTLTVNGVPIIEIARPSRVSGPDFADTVVGNPWDMNGPPDISMTEHITNLEYVAGIVEATSDTSTDPGLHLNVADPVDPDRFKYLTFRYMLDGPRNIGLGSASRLIWWGPQGPSNAGVLLDMIAYEGWHTYSLDLTTALLAGGPAWTADSWTTLRFDPHEFAAQRIAFLDFVLLTADDEAQQQFPIQWSLSGDFLGDSLTTRLYYDTDTDWDNGKTLITEIVDPIPKNRELLGDFDGDGVRDRVTIDPGPRGIWRLAPAQEPGFRIPNPLDADSEDLSPLTGFYDLNGDGSSDILFTRGNAEGPLWASFSDGASFRTPQPLGAGFSPSLRSYLGLQNFEHLWNTAPSDTYYIWVEVFDGHNAVRRVSEAPVVVDNPCQTVQTILDILDQWRLTVDIRDLVLIANNICGSP